MVGANRFNTHLTILTAEMAANLQQAVERSICAELSGHHPAGAGLIPRRLQHPHQIVERGRALEL